MSTVFTAIPRKGFDLPVSPLSWTVSRVVLGMMLLLWMATACTRLHAPEMQPDPEAERLVANLRRINADLVQFKCIGKIRLSRPDQPAQAFRAAVAGKLTDRLRIDVFAPFGGASGTVASDGKYLYFVSHRPREYHKRRFGHGSLRRFIKADLTVGDLLVLLVGRMPVHDGLYARMMDAGDTNNQEVRLVDERGKTRQRIVFDAAGRPVRSEWFDDSQRTMVTLRVSGEQVIDGYVLPTRIELAAASGQRISIILDRYEANAGLDAGLFVPTPL
jgi:hypothetical protein